MKKVWYIYSTYKGVSSSGPFYSSKKKAEKALSQRILGHSYQILDNGYENSCFGVCDGNGDMHYYQILSAEVK